MRESYHHGNLRAELVRLAEAEIASAGLQHFGLREIARKVGVSSGAAFRHFENKEALVLAIAAEGFRELLARLGALDGLEPRERLRRGFQVYLAFAAERSGALRAMFGGVLERSSPETEAMRLSVEAFAWLENSVKDGETSGLLRPAPGSQTALVFFSALHGAAVLHLEMGTFPAVGPLSPEELAKILFESLIKGLNP